MHTRNVIKMGTGSADSPILPKPGQQKSDNLTTTSARLAFHAESDTMHPDSHHTELLLRSTSFDAP